MNPDRPNVETLFHRALEVEPDERAAFLADGCGGDAALQRRVEALLAAHEQAKGFLPEGSAEGTATLLEETSLTETPGSMIGRYKLLEKLGEGGFGVVWAAEQREPIRRRVALKIIKLGMDTQQVIARFEAERQALALMDHPNIAKVLDAGATDVGRLYFVMELVRGIPITKYCDEERVSTAERLDLFIKICHALQHAHQKGVIHRDIKPSNIMVTLHDGMPVPKVIDFGIAKATQAELTEKTIYTQYQQFIGTPAYMSPEQAEMSGLDMDTRSDIYALGVLLYELLTGRTPFDGKALLEAGLDEMRRIIREQEPQRPSTKVATLRVAELSTTATRHRTEAPKFIRQLRGDLDWIVMKCLEKDRTRRYETANELAMDLKRHLKNETIVARPPSSSYRFQKLVRRNKIAFAAATAVAAALVAGLGVSVWQATVANRAREAGQRLLYAANMNLAQQAWEENNVGRVRQLLQETATYPQRGFEWYYWQRQTHLEIKTFRGHSDGVWAVAFSPDGRRIATGSSDHTAKVWDAATAQELLTLTGHNDWVSSVAFFPDGRRIVTGSADQTAKIWDAASGQELLMLAGHRHWITSVALSPDGRRILTGSHDQTAKLWDADSGDELRTLKASTPWVTSRGIGGVAFSQDGQQLATASHDRTATIWDADSGQEILTVAGHDSAVWSVAFSPDGRFLVTGSYDRTAKVWDAATGKQLFTLDCASIGSPGVSSVAFSPSGYRIATGAWNDTAKVWEASTGKELFTLKGHSDGVSSVIFSPDGQRILTGSRGHTAKIWEGNGGGEVLTLNGHNGGISGVAFSPDGQQLATASDDHTAKLWDAASAKDLLTLQGHTHEVSSVAFSHDGQRIVTGSSDRTFKLWQAGRGIELLTVKAHADAITAVAFSPDDRRIVTGSYDQTAKVWDAANGKELFTLRGHIAFINSVALSPDGQCIATGSYDGTAGIWDATTGKNLHMLRGTIAAITAQHAAWVSGGSLTLKGRSAAMKSVAFSRDSRRLITGSHDGTAIIWDAVSGKELLRLKGHSGAVSSVAFSPDGRRIITGSYDRTAKLWEAATGKELLTFAGHNHWITSAVFSPDGLRIVTGSADRSVNIWRAATPQQVAEWQQEESAAAARMDEVRRQQNAAAERARALRAQDPGMITQWLVLGPIPCEGTNGATALDQPQMPDEAHLHPRADQRVSVGESAKVWRRAHANDYQFDFSEPAGAVNVTVTYAVSYIESDVDRAHLVMKVASDDQAKVYLNGREIHRRSNARTYIADQDAVAGVELKAGLNVLVFKVVNETRGSQGSIRLTDAADQILQGIRVTLDPNAQAQR